MANLRREGHPDEHLHLVGNVMIDTLLRLLPKAKESESLRQYGLEPGRYGVVTLHRPANVDRAETLGPLLDVLHEASQHLPLVFPVHPRTREWIDRFGFANRLSGSNGIRFLPPLGYLDFLSLTS